MNIEEKLIKRNKRTIPDPGEALCDAARAVGGGVIDHQNLKRNALLHHQRAQAALEVRLFIARREL